MRKLILFLFIIANVILILSCDDQVEPKTDFNEVYALNCVIRCDTSYQVATITCSYDVEGYNPSSNMNDPFLEGAKITLTYDSPYGAQVYQFRDTSITRSDTSRYKEPLHFYYLKNFQPLYRGNIKIEAVLPSGEKLTATTRPIIIDKYLINSFIQKNPKPVYPDRLTFDWEGINGYCLGEFIVKYVKNENGNWVNYQKVIPRYYSIVKNVNISVFPSIMPVQKFLDYDTLTIRTALEEISYKDPNKQNYIILNTFFMLNILDANFATYIASQQTYKDEFSVRLTLFDFSNSNGGLGIFGTMYTIKKEVLLTNMIRSLGYRTN